MLYKQRSYCQGLRIDLHEILIAELKLMFKITAVSLNIHPETSAEIYLDN
jgi:hypothetical protein